VTLSGSGPLVVDIPKVMRAAADRDLLITAASKWCDGVVGSRHG
jgi:hypothetical protein